MWFWIIGAAVILAIMAALWLLAPLSVNANVRRGGSTRRGSSTSYTTDTQVVQAQANSARAQTPPLG